MKTRHLTHAVPDCRGGPTILVLVEVDGAAIRRYECADGSFRTVEHAGRVWRLSGRDRASGEWAYLPESAVA